MMETSVAESSTVYNRDKNGISLGKMQTDEECSSESGIDETEFKTIREESAQIFARNGEGCSSFSFDDVLDSLTVNKTARKSSLSRVELDTTKRLLLKVDRGNVRAKYGYDIDRDAYLYPEEALYLLELGKIEIFSEYVSLSIQRARSLLLMSQRDGTSDNLAGCTTEEYSVYKYLSRMGYCLFRHAGNLYDARTVESPVEEFTNLGTSENIMDDSTKIYDDDIIVEMESEEDNVIDLDLPEPRIPNQLSEQRKSLKRKLSASDPDEIQYIQSDELMDSSVDTIGVYSENGNLHNEQDRYTVDEADSDVEIVDEVIYSHHGVEIQEIGHSIGCTGADDVDISTQTDPVPSTSKGLHTCEVLVDLVSSDEDEEDLKSFTNKIWAKFIPNSKLVFGIPPSSLIPQKIVDSDSVYEFDLKDKSDVSDLELEFLVDEVSLNDDRCGIDPWDSSQQPSASTSRSWKEWRQSVFREARHVMNDSLLASPESECIGGEAAAKKLFLWNEHHSESHCSSFNSIVFKMYGPITQGFSRTRQLEGKPSYFIFVARQDEPVPDFGSMGSHFDGVPLLMAIVCDSGENDIVFVTADRSPLNSLF